MGKTAKKPHKTHAEVLHNARIELQREMADLNVAIKALNIQIKDLERGGKSSKTPEQQAIFMVLSEKRDQVKAARVNVLAVLVEIQREETKHRHAVEYWKRRKTPSLDSCTSKELPAGMQRLGNQSAI